MSYLIVLQWYHFMNIYQSHYSEVATITMSNWIIDNIKIKNMQKWFQIPCKIMLSKS